MLDILVFQIINSSLNIHSCSLIILRKKFLCDARWPWGWVCIHNLPTVVDCAIYNGKYIWFLKSSKFSRERKCAANITSILVTEVFFITLKVLEYLWVKSKNEKLLYLFLEYIKSYSSIKSFFTMKTVLYNSKHLKSQASLFLS